jgi:hypothetical protein
VQNGKMFYRFIPVGGWNRVYIGIGETQDEAWREVLAFDADEAIKKVAA